MFRAQARPQVQGGAGENNGVGVGTHSGGALVPTFSARCILEGWPEWRLPALAKKPIPGMWPGSHGQGRLVCPLAHAGLRS